MLISSEKKPEAMKRQQPDAAEQCGNFVLPRRAGVCDPKLLKSHVTLDGHTPDQAPQTTCDIASRKQNVQ